MPSTAAGPFDIPLGECVAGREMHGYRFMSCKQLDAGLQKIGRCCSCSSPLQLTESFSKRKGLVSKISIVCSNPECLESVTVSDPSTVEATNLNVRSVLGMRMIGCGRTKLDTYMACMEMLPPLSPSYEKLTSTTTYISFFKFLFTSSSLFLSLILLLYK